MCKVAFFAEWPGLTRCLYNCFHDIFLLTDWEYPDYEPHSGTEADTVNFNLLFDDVRAALGELEAETGKFYGLTAALPCGPSIIDNMVIEHVGRLVSEAKAFFCLLSLHIA